MGEARVARTELADYGTPGRRYDLLEVDHVRLAFFDEGTHRFGSLNSVLVVKTINIPRQQLETPTGVIFVKTIQLIYTPYLEFFSAIGLDSWSRDVLLTTLQLL